MSFPFVRPAPSSDEIGSFLLDLLARTVPVVHQDPALAIISDHRGAEWLVKIYAGRTQSYDLLVAHRNELEEALTKIGVDALVQPSIFPRRRPMFSKTGLEGRIAIEFPVPRRRRSESDTIVRETVEEARGRAFTELANLFPVNLESGHGGDDEDVRLRVSLPIAEYNDSLDRLPLHLEVT